MKTTEEMAEETLQKTLNLYDPDPIKAFIAWAIYEPEQVVQFANQIHLFFQVQTETERMLDCMV